MLKKFLSAGVVTAMTLSVCNADVKLTNFDKKMIEVEKKMVSVNKRFNVNEITIDKKRKIDDKWTMYIFKMNIEDTVSKRKSSAPMIIFTDGIYQTNSLMNLKTGKRYETEEKIRLRDAMDKKQNSQREKFEKSFVLDKKYYNKEHLIAGSLNAKNKIIMISDPLCVACIETFPSIYNAVKDKKDYALFYYHFPLQRLHPTAMTIAKAMEYAKGQGLKDVVKKIMFADLGKSYDVYKENNPKIALKAFNHIMGTDYTLDQIEKISIKNDIKIGSDVRLQGTPTIIYNGELYKSRENLAKSFTQN